MFTSVSGTSIPPLPASAPTAQQPAAAQLTPARLFSLPGSGLVTAAQVAAAADGPAVDTAPAGSTEPGPATAPPARASIPAPTQARHRAVPAM